MGVDFEVEGGVVEHQLQSQRIDTAAAASTADVSSRDGHGAVPSDAPPLEPWIAFAGGVTSGMAGICVGQVRGAGPPPRLLSSGGQLVHCMTTDPACLQR
jgi:hypothetical protein